MLETFFATLSPMLMLFSCIVIGYFLSKKKICPANTANVLSRLETTVIVPALTLSSMMNNCTLDSLKVDYEIVLYAFLILAVALSVALPISKLFVREGYVRNVYKYALTFGNCGFVGNALTLALMGDVGLYKYLLFTFPLNIVIYMWGYTILTQSGKGGKVFKQLLNPAFVAVITGILMGLTGLSRYLPSFATTTLSQLGACMGPLAMILTGFVVADYDFVSLLKNKKVYIATLLRLIVLPLVFFAILKIAGASKEIAFFCLFAFGAPLGLNTVVFPASVGGDTSTGASMAMISHTLCVITIPVMYMFINMIF